MQDATRSSSKNRDDFLIRLIAARADRPDPLAPEVRFPLRDTFAEVMLESGRRSDHLAAVCDISLRGARLLCHEHHAPGETIRIRLLDAEGPLLPCLVKWTHHESGDDSWFVGVEFGERGVG